MISSNKMSFYTYLNIVINDRYFWIEYIGNGKAITNSWSVYSKSNALSNKL